MAQSERQSWIQSNLGAGVSATIIGLLLGTIVNAVFEGMPLWLRLLVIGGAAIVAIIVASLISTKWRARSWQTWGRWIGGLGVLTNRKRAAIRQEGYDARSLEIDNERAYVKQPAWRFDARDALGERNLLWLNNHGGEALDVNVTCDPDLFVLDGQVHWDRFGSPHGTGGSVGSWFKGYPTEVGKVQGVTFHVAWRDSAGDPQASDVFFPPEEFRAGRDEALDDAYARGRTEGRAEAFEEQAPTIPLPRPRWTIYRNDAEDANENEYVVRNAVPRSVAKEVRVEGDGDITIFDAGQWEDLTGPATGTFQGETNLRGQREGVRFEITWYDENGKLDRASSFVPGDGHDPERTPF